MLTCNVFALYSKRKADEARKKAQESSAQPPVDANKSKQE
jgi:hypothetical protein